MKNIFKPYTASNKIVKYKKLIISFGFLFMFIPLIIDTAFSSSTSSLITKILFNVFVFSLISFLIWKLDMFQKIKTILRSEDIDNRNIYYIKDKKRYASLYFYTLLASIFFITIDFLIIFGLKKVTTISIISKSIQASLFFLYLLTSLEEFYFIMKNNKPRNFRVFFYPNNLDNVLTALNLKEITKKYNELLTNEKYCLMVNGYGTKDFEISILTKEQYEIKRNYSISLYGEEQYNKFIKQYNFEDYYIGEDKIKNRMNKLKKLFNELDK